MSGAYSPELSNPKGSIPGGVLGAFLGAIVGAVPYEAALILQGTDFIGTELWEVTGLVAGYCACLGYRGLRGRRSTSMAYVSVMAAAALVLIGANLAAELYAAGMPAGGMDAVLNAVRRMLGPERRVGLAVGVFWGLLGVWSARQYLLWYTNPALAAEKYGEAVFREPVFRGTVPERFAVRSKHRWMSVFGLLCAVLFGVLLAVAVLAFDPVTERNWLILCVCLCPLGVIGGVWSALRRWNCRIEVERECLLYVDALGRKRDFYVREIRGMSRSALTGVYQLYDGEGWPLGWFDPVLENGTFLIQYLRERGIGLKTGTTS